MTIAVVPSSLVTGSFGANGTGDTPPGSVVVNPPSGLSPGDTWIIAAVGWWGTGAVWNTPSGFTALTMYAQGSNVDLQVWYRHNCSGSESAVTITNTPPSGSLYVYASWRHTGGAINGPIIDINDGAFTNTFAAIDTTVIDQTNAAHLPTQHNSLIYLIWAEGTGNTSAGNPVTHTVPAGYTSLASVTHDTAGNFGTWLGVDYALQTVATNVPITTTTITMIGQSAGGGVIGLILSFLPYVEQQNMTREGCTFDKKAALIQL